MTTRPLGSFCAYHLRTTDVESARAFYAEVLGFDFPVQGGPALAGGRLQVWPLHEQARARGAPAHWLGFIGVSDLAATVEKLLGHGAQLLGPPMLRGEDGEAFAILRDPCEAVVGVREIAPEPASTLASASASASRERDGGLASASPSALALASASASESALAASSTNLEPAGVVAWHQLHSRDRDRSWAVYAELFGWTSRTGDINVEHDGGHEPEGGYRMFRWQGMERAKDVGSMANTARLPGVHAHWLYYFPVDNLDTTLAKVTARGGLALPPVTLPNGDRLAACEDAQKAAFGVVQPAQATLHDREAR
jgi:uncharacterized protein